MELIYEGCRAIKEDGNANEVTAAPKVCQCQCKCACGGNKAYESNNFNQDWSSNSNITQPAEK